MTSRIVKWPHNPYFLGFMPLRDPPPPCMWEESVVCFRAVKYSKCRDDGYYVRLYQKD